MSLSVRTGWIIILCLACTSRSTDSGQLVDELAALNLPRRIEPRLSIPVAYTAPDQKPTDAPSASVIAIGTRASRAVLGAVDPDALQAAALVDLLWTDEEGIALERSIKYLMAASTLAPTRASVFTDLSAAYIVRAKRDDSPRDLLLAIDAADRALQLDPSSTSARFNLALSLERLNLVEQAAKVWQTFLRAEPKSAWTAEARKFAISPMAAPEAREVGWNEVLGAWGAAVIAHDDRRADSLLRVADSLGRVSKDATLADAVDSIRSCRDIQTLARAHVDYAAGQTHYRAVRAVEALPLFKRAVAGSACSPTLREWSRVFEASSLVYLRRFNEAERLLRQVIVAADTARHPALAARARWSLGVGMTRQGKHGGVAYARQAEPLFARIGEREYEGMQQFLDGEADHDVGNTVTAYRKLTTALGTLRAHRASRWRHNTLILLASAASKEGLFRATRYIQSEDIAVASRIDQPYYRIEARLARARLTTAFGDSALASADLDSAATEIDRLDPGEARRWFEASRRIADAGRIARRAPARAVAELDSATSEPAIASNPLLLLPAIVVRADAHLTLGDVTRAISDVEKALNLLDKRRSEIAEAPLRASMLDAAHDVVDRLVMLHLRSGDSTEALAVLERGRSSFATVATSAPRASHKTIRAPHGEVALEYALIGDTLLTWTIADTTVRLVRTPVDRSRLSRTIDQARASLELRAADSTVLPSLSALHDWLVRPIEALVDSKDQRVVIIADGEIARVPFAALYDSKQRSYFIESHVIRAAPSLVDAVGSAPSSRARPSDALLVANTSPVGPALQSRTDLPAARAELHSIAVNYPGARILDSHTMAESTFVRALGRAEIAHFAGHATFDDERPERSYLEIGDTKEGSGRLAARQLSALDLRRLRLMVLSACETMPGQSGRSGGFAGFTSALLAAGVGGVVGSLWRVEDEATRDLMTAFHKSYAARGDGPAALRDAQLRLLGSTSAARQSPAAWAAFRYAGR